MEDVGYVSQDETLLEEMELASAHGSTEPELMEAVTAAISFPSTAPTSPDES